MNKNGESISFFFFKKKYEAISFLEKLIISWYIFFEGIMIKYSISFIPYSNYFVLWKEK